ncbi:MAG: metallophosphoesterase [Rhodospirillales bacterium]|nr:metallophosphoesterase [Rhodospirillales bacterium]
MVRWSIFLALVLPVAFAPILPVAVATAPAGAAEIAADLKVAPDLKVAFIGDQGCDSGWPDPPEWPPCTPDPRLVLELIRDEKAELVIHLGDFDYTHKPDRFDELVGQVLGPAFPYLAVAGNHDVEKWDGYRAKLEARLARTPDAKCKGDIGVMAACAYKGLFIAFAAPGIFAHTDESFREHAAYLRQALAASGARWKICAWHRNQRQMQLGEKGRRQSDKTGWGVYEACRAAGAIIATGHEHSYSRTHLMAKFADRPKVASKDNTLKLARGRTFAFVSGLGGRKPRSQVEPSDKWWAAIYTATQGAKPGALFCTFNPGGRAPDRADCYFKAIHGAVPDRFRIVAPAP